MLRPSASQRRGAKWRRGATAPVDLVAAVADKTITLYRTARTCTNQVGLFWTPDREYARYIHATPDFTACAADLVAGARQLHFGGSPTKALIARLIAQAELDVAIFDVWDWDTTEYVILNPAVLTNVRVVHDTKLIRFRGATYRLARFNRTRSADMLTLEQQEELLRPEAGEELTRRQQERLLRSGARYWNPWYASIQQPALLVGLRFEHIDLTGLNLSGAILDNTDFFGCNLTDVNFYGASARSRIRFIETSCAGVNFSKTNFSGVFCKVAFVASDKQRCRLEGMTWKGDMLDTDLSNQDLRGSSLHLSINGVAFRGTGLHGVNFNNSALSNVDLTRADLSGAKFREVERLENVIWEKAVYNYRTTFPPKFDSAASGLRKGRGQEGISLEEIKENLEAIERSRQKREGVTSKQRGQKYCRFNGAVYRRVGGTLYDLSEVQSPYLPEIGKRWRENKATPRGWNELTLWVPTDLLYHRAMKRAPGGAGYRDPAQWKELVDSIKYKGFDPEQSVGVTIKADGRFYISDGNHRVAVAKQLGLLTVPVHLHFSKSWGNPYTSKDMNAQQDPDLLVEATEALLNDIVPGVRHELINVEAAWKELVKVDPEVASQAVPDKLAKMIDAITEALKKVLAILASVRTAASRRRGGDISLEEMLEQILHGYARGQEPEVQHNQERWVYKRFWDSFDEAGREFNRIAGATERLLLSFTQYPNVVALLKQINKIATKDFSNLRESIDG